jgi:hypothetical protein
VFFLLFFFGGEKQPRNAENHGTGRIRRTGRMWSAEAT